MALVPVRNLGQLGVITDIDPNDLPPNAFTYAANVRFADNKVSRGPVFSKLGQTTSNLYPRWVYSYRLQEQTSTFISCNKDGTLATLVPSGVDALTYEDVSVAAYTPSDQDLPYTATVLSNVAYVNRQDRVPWSLVPGDTDFSTLSGWDSTWRCKALRSFNGCLVAMNVTKGATEYPTMVKTSDFAPFATVPGSWNASLVNSATENVLSDLTEPLVDGWPLRDRFILYANNETWYMELSNDAFVYTYKPLFSNWGVISPNCLAEINGIHYVFGSNDIWMHDGFTPKSLATGRVRKFIFNNLVASQAYQFFVWMHPALNEIRFCYVSEDPYCAFPVGGNIGYPGCNRAAVYNWQYDTWQFYDLPYVIGGALGDMYGGGGSGLTYADMSATTYEGVTGVYQATTDTTRLFSLAVGRGGSVENEVLPMQSTGSWDSATHLYSFELLEDVAGVGSLVNVVNAPVFIENIQMDMDDISKELRGYKIVTSMYPEGWVIDPENPMHFWWGSSDYISVSADYGDSQTFNGRELYKLDFNNPGRYLSLRMAIANPPQRFMLTGFDIEYKVTGHR